jgi:hypothetical protein
MSGGWDERLAWVFDLIADSPAQRRQAQERLTQTRQQWAQALHRYNQVWNNRSHPEYQERFEAFWRAHDFTYPHALWRKHEEATGSWPGLPYAVLYLQWEALYPHEWFAFKTGWGTKVGVLRDLVRTAKQLPPATVGRLEDLVMMAVRREYRCEDIGYARLARVIDSPGLRARLEVAAQDTHRVYRAHAGYLLWLLDHPDLPHPRASQWHAWLADS